MTITVDIRPEVEAELIRQATARGRAIEAHAASLLKEAVCLRACRLPLSTGNGRGPRESASGNYARASRSGG